MDSEPEREVLVCVDPRDVEAWHLAREQCAAKQPVHDRSGETGTSCELEVEVEPVQVSARTREANEAAERHLAEIAGNESTRNCIQLTGFE